MGEKENNVIILKVIHPQWATAHWPPLGYDPEAFYFLMNRVAFLIDGFNLYHSVLRLMRDTGSCTKWLDLYSLCQSYLHLFGKDTDLVSVYYFSALPHHLSSTQPGKIDRHQRFLSCLKDSGVIVELGRFKEKEVFCTKCRSVFSEA